MTDIRPISYGPARGGLGEIVSVTPGPARDPEETAMTDLITFLRAQLDADEQAAHAGSTMWAVVYSNYEPAEVDSIHHNRATAEARAGELADEWRVDEWVSRPDPARKARNLAEVEAKRRILDRYEEAKPYYDQHLNAPAGELHGLYTAIQFLALPFSDRPGYDETWRPA